jgi:hypothetical protein
MSLESMFASLSIADASSVVEKIKAEGIEKSGFVENIEILKAKVASSVESEALAGLATVKAVAENAPEAEAINKECLTACKFNSLSQMTSHSIRFTCFAAWQCWKPCPCIHLHQWIKSTFKLALYIYL